MFGLGAQQTKLLRRELAFRGAARGGGAEGGSAVAASLLPSPGAFSAGEGRPVFSPDAAAAIAAYEAGALSYDPARGGGSGAYPFASPVQGGRAVEQHGRVSRSCRHGEVALGAALEYEKGLMVGLSLSGALGTSLVERALKETDLGGDDDYAVLRGGTRYTGFASVTARQRAETALVGGACAAASLFGSGRACAWARAPRRQGSTGSRPPTSLPKSKRASRTDARSPTATTGAKTLRATPRGTFSGRRGARAPGCSSRPARSPPMLPSA